MLPVAQFCFNNHVSSNGVTPFYANYGFHPRLEDILGRQLNDQATMKVEIMQTLHKKLSEDLEFVRTRIAKFADI